MQEGKSQTRDEPRIQGKRRIDIHATNLDPTYSSNVSPQHSQTRQECQNDEKATVKYEKKEGLERGRDVPMPL